MVEMPWWNTAEIKHAVSKVNIGQEEHFLMLQKVQHTQQVLLALAQSRDGANLKLLDSYRQQQKKDQISITRLEWLIKKQRAESDIGPESSVQREASRAFNPRAESQAHTILNQDRFFDWMQQGHPDIPLVDGGLPGSAQDGISPMSLLCANLSLTLRELEPDSIFAMFVCGLHTSPYNDDWYGPSGMLRFLVAQLLLALLERNSLDLGCLDRRSHVRVLERHDLEASSDLFGDLARQFDAETTIYVIIDGVSKFDVDFRNTFQKLEMAIRWLEDIVKDDGLRPKLKILMTVPFRSSIRLRQSVDDRFRLALPLQLSAPRTLSRGSILSSILSPSTLQSAATPSSLQNDLPEWGGEDYDDE
ncbi:hypothetical protein CSAL01_04355 [Colletotrichum salicis]|uniref:Uncharacterized protein n=1 Tax=Colletotrichum salicis TaxID=1209931 RepID=A0A135UGS1_9PEZI|nr:hypothetical protein CSAL01_04355 [Colletotrichum salicis]